MSVANIGFNLEFTMHLRHSISIEDWMLIDDTQAMDPLEILIRAELEQDADLAGYDSVDDYLHANPEITFN